MSKGVYRFCLFIMFGGIFVHLLIFVKSSALKYFYRCGVMYYAKQYEQRGK